MTKQKGIIIGQTILYSAIVGIIGFYGGLHFRHEDRIDALMIKAAESIIRQENMLEEMRRSRAPVLKTMPLVYNPKEV